MLGGKIGVHDLLGWMGLKKLQTELKPLKVNGWKKTGGTRSLTKMANQPESAQSETKVESIQPSARG